MSSTCAPDCASWTSIGLCVSSVLSSRCLGFMIATASSCKRKVCRSTEKQFSSSSGFLKMVDICNSFKWFNFPVLNVFLGGGSGSSAQQQIHKMLGDILDGMNRVRVAVVTPYFYTIGESYWVVIHLGIIYWFDGIFSHFPLLQKS